MIRHFLLILLASLFLAPARAQEAEQPLVYIIPVKDMIEPALLYVIRRGVDEATRNKADAIILQMDTTGGRVDSALAILDVMQRSEIPIYTFVEGEAISAGALIALATPKIYMRPGSVIGDITPISLGLVGGVQELPAAEKEKMTSYVAAHVRAAAERGGYDPEMAEAMVRADLEFMDGDDVIIPSGHVLTMTNKEAERLVGEDRHPLLSQGTVEDIDEMLERLGGLSGAEKQILEVTSAERLARFIAKLAPFLLIIGLGGIWLEIKTPGFGIFGIVGISSLLLFFFGHHIAGLAGYEDLLIFAVGLTLLAVEVFITPGFGIMGIGGLILIVVSLISAMSEHLPGQWRPVSFSPEVLAIPLLKVALAFTGSVLLVLLAGKYLPKTRLLNGLMLEDVSPAPANPGEGLVGRTGYAHSDLRPSGAAYFDGRKYDVVTHGDFIPKGAPVRVVEAHGSRIVVEEDPRQSS